MSLCWEFPFISTIAQEESTALIVESKWRRSLIFITVLAFWSRLLPWDQAGRLCKVS
jgi:hypothetical protein